MANHQCMYDVFLSFRGEDTRYNFVCHLSDALSRKGLITFIDNQVPRGQEINPILHRAIQMSKVALIIFSDNYASSTWCLDELLRIIECHETHNQIVVPVFYRVSPSDVRKQVGSFKESFEKHNKNSGNSSKIQKWKDAMTKASNFSGWDSNAIRPDNTLIDLIVKDILEKLEHPLPCSLEGFVGLASKVRQVKSLLAVGSSDVRILGIWGMGGIGKTTIAEAIFALFSSQFEGHCFLRNAREVSELGGGIQKLLGHLVSELLEERDVKINTINIGPGLSFVERLNRKRVLVVLDDMSDPLELEFLIGNPCWFGSGSKIIITSRDKQVFEKIAAAVYNVEPLTYAESHQLFVMNAFKQKHLWQDYMPLLDSFVCYAKGNPLAIKVLGSYVCGKGVKLWKDTMDQLSKFPNEKIQNVLKLSYDGLNREEKAIFLHIACFLKGENKDDAVQLLSNCGLSADIGLSVLVDKSLVIISESNELDMHDLLQKMGKDIVRLESDDPSQRSRLWDAEEICHVLEKNRGTGATESIVLNMSHIRDIELDPDVFRRMPNLKFLKFYSFHGEKSKLKLSQSLNYLPSELRYLCWDGYPLESLPADFDSKELLVLELRNSNIKQLMKEVKTGGKLTVAAQSLIKSGFVSHITNIFSMLSPGFGSLKVPSSSMLCQFFSKITHINMKDCQNLRSFPKNVDLNCLEILNLGGCSNLERFPEISSNVKELYLAGTAIKEVSSSSIERLSRLETLRMNGCEKLESLPSNIYKLKSLQKLYLEKCSNLKKFPEILEPMYNLRELELFGSGIAVIPSSIENLKGLEFLDMEECRNVAYLPASLGNLVKNICSFYLSSEFKKRKLGNNSNLSQFEVSKRLKHWEPQNLLDLEDSECFSFDFSLSVGHESASSTSVMSRITIRKKHLDREPELISQLVHYLADIPSHPCFKWISPAPYYILDLSKLSIRELPTDLGCLYYFRQLDLRRNDFERIPESIKQLSQLDSLDLYYCKSLQSLPQLPKSLCRLTAANCASLKTVSALKQQLFSGCTKRFNFVDCLTLDEMDCQAMASNMLTNGPKDVNFCYPGTRIPEWFQYQTIGDTIRIKLASNWLINHSFFGFAFCIVYNSYYDGARDGNIEFECCFEDNNNSTTLFHYQTNYRTCYNRSLGKFYPSKSGKQHVLIWSIDDFNKWMHDKRQLFSRHCLHMASFKFYNRYAGGGLIKRCGITPLYAQDNDDDESLLLMEVSSKMEEKLEK